MRWCDNVTLTRAALILPVLFVLCSPRKAAAIVNGTPDGNAHPAVGAVVLDPQVADELGFPVIHCTCTLIHPRIVLTAGHCTALLESDLALGLYSRDDVGVTFASDASNPDIVLSICDVITHPDFDANVSSGQGNVSFVDVGLLILSEAVENPTPVMLATMGFLDALDAAGELQAHPGDGTPFVVAGYGTDEVHPPGNPVPPPDGLRRFAVTEFRELFARWLVTSQNFSQDEGGTGIADSGGPAFWVDPLTGVEIQVGINSRADFGIASYTGFYRVDVSETLGFIDAVVADCAETDGW